MFPRIRWATPEAIRSFSTTTRVHGQISHIGRTPITVPATVTVTPTPDAVAVKGPLGETAVPVKPFVRLTFPKDNVLHVAVEDPTIKTQRQMWGLTRTLINNAVVGMTEGFTVPLYLVGVGYRALIEADPRGTSQGNSGQRLAMKLGHSHWVYVPIPTYIKAEVPQPTKIMLFCTDKHLLGLFAAKVRKLRPPEPYKGKGVFVGSEQIRIKQVKKK